MLQKTRLRDQFAEDLWGERRSLKAQAMLLTGNPARAEDLVHETMLLAIRHRHTFDGKNLGGWLHTILYNKFATQYRKLKREVEDADGTYTASLTMEEEQIWRIVGKDISRAIDSLSTSLRQAFLLVVIEGKSYAEAAQLQNVAEGDHEVAGKPRQRTPAKILEPPEEKLREENDVPDWILETFRKALEDLRT